MATGATKNMGAWIAFAFAVLSQLLTIAYFGGRQTERLESIDKRLDRVERVLMVEHGAAQVR